MKETECIKLNRTIGRVRIHHSQSGYRLIIHFLNKKGKKVHFRSPFAETEEEAIDFAPRLISLVNGEMGF